MSAKLEAHRREQFVLVIGFATRGESCVERRGQNGGRNGFVDRRADGPPPFTGIRNSSCKTAQARILGKSRRRQIKKPGRHDAAAPPELSYICQVEVILVMFGMSQWRCLGIDFMIGLPDVGF